MTKAKMLVVGADSGKAESFGAELSELGFDVARIVPFDGIPEGRDGGEFDIAVVDLDDDAEGGIQSVRRIAEKGEICGIAVVASGKAKERAIAELGGDVGLYIGKPLDPAELDAAVDHITRFTCLRREVSEKNRRLNHLEVLNEIIRASLLSDGDEDILWYLARLIQEKFGYFNVNIFLVNETRDRVVLKAFAGGFGDDFVVGYSLAFGEGVVGWAAKNRQSLLIGDVRKDPRRIQGFAFEEFINSELAVPILYENGVLGVIHTESGEFDAFSRDDITVLEMIADQASLSFEKTRLSRELTEAHRLSRAINDSLPVSIVLVDENLRIEWMNRTFRNFYGTSGDEHIGQSVLRYIPEVYASVFDIEHVFKKVLANGAPVVYENIRYVSPGLPERLITITLSCVQAGPSPRVMILFQDVTDFMRKTYQLSLLRKISISMQGELERDKLLHLILTCVTAGFAIGFNRAFLFLVDRDRNELRGIMGVGPISHEEAYRIWSDLSREALTFELYLENVNRGLMVRSGLQDLVESVTIDLEEAQNILAQTAKTGVAVHVRNAWEHPLVDDEMRKLLVSDEFVVAPLIVKNEVIGLLLADNAFSGRPIAEESVEVLTMYTAQAAIAIENAKILGDLAEKVEELEEAYRNLEKAQDMLVRNERLAAIGEMSARLAHEIRNPLATIGGFAKSIQKKYQDRDRTVRNANIIVEEVQRLENILTNVLDFTKTGEPKKNPGDLNELVRKTLAVMEGNIVSRGVVVVLDLSGNDPAVEFDESQIKQVLINLIQNAINAMPEGGALEIRTNVLSGEFRVEIRDTGIGIPSQHLENIFEPFFTTRGNGTGLGLSISNRIVQNHGGRIEITSTEGSGTTVAIVLPIP